MRGIASLILLLLAFTDVTKAMTPLTTAVNSNWLPRIDSPSLESIALQRAIEISCGDPCFSHALMRPGTAEVLAWNSGFTDPIPQAIMQWKNSVDHDTILSDPIFTHIGCATYQVVEKVFFVCVLQSLSPVTTPPEPVPVPVPTLSPVAPPLSLPDTAAEK